MYFYEYILFIYQLQSQEILPQVIYGIGVFGKVYLLVLDNTKR